MSDEIYHKLAKVLDTLPNGFPSTESGVEIQLLKKVFEPSEAELFCRLKLGYETPEQIAGRTGLPLEGLAGKLITMWQKGQIESQVSGGTRIFKMVPWIIGIYEFQQKRMDKEFAELCQAYGPFLGPQLVTTRPQIMQVLPVEKIIPTNFEALPYEKVSSIIEKGKSFAVANCICRKQKRLLNQGCDKPLEICMSISGEAGDFVDSPYGLRIISKEEAYALLQKAEDAALVHMTGNVEEGHWYICNCCGCCDGQLGAIAMGLEGTVNSHYYAEIDPDLCSACGLCVEERCQVKAIEEVDGSYRVIKTRCIGCGLCVTACPTEAARLIHKSPEEIRPPAKDEMDWFEKRAQARGVDFTAFK